MEGFTYHAQRRARQKAVRPLAVDLALRYGMQIEQNQGSVYYLGKRHIPEGLEPKTAERVEGTAVILGRQGWVVTVFRNRRGLPQKIKKRGRYGKGKVV